MYATINKPRIHIEIIYFVCRQSRLRRQPLVDTVQTFHSAL